MAIIKDLLSSLENIEGRSREQNDRISAALLHIRACEILHQTRFSIIATVVLAWIIAVATQIGLLLAFPVSHTAKFMVVCVFAVAGLYIGSLTPESALLPAIYGLVIGYLTVNPKMTLGAVKAFFFDFADIVSYGTVTKAFAKFVADGGEQAACRALKHKESNILPEPIAVHFYASRHAFKRIDRLKNEEERVLDSIVETTDNDVVSKTCEEYWKSTETK